jgi:DNA repair protein RadC
MNTYALTDNDRLLDVADPIKKYVLKIRDLPNESRPREKMLSAGPAALSSAELLAVILNTGTTKEDVLRMSARVLKEYGERSLSSAMNAAALSKELDIPIGKALQIVACAELGRRFFKVRKGGLSVVRTAKDAYRYFKDMQHLPKEHLRGIYLDTHYRVIHDEVISIGTINSNIIHPREVFAPAIEYSAAAVILAHNHPSGVVKASQADIEITRQLVEAGKLLGINLIDHLIITASGFASIDVDYSAG